MGVRHRVVVQVEAHVGVLPTFTATRSPSAKSCSGNASKLRPSASKAWRTLKALVLGPAPIGGLTLAPGRACAFRSAKSVNVRAAKKLSRM
jgi:hypothetical protein